MDVWPKKGKDGEFKNVAGVLASMKDNDFFTGRMAGVKRLACLTIVATPSMRILGFVEHNGNAHTFEAGTALSVGSWVSYCDAWTLSSLKLATACERCPNSTQTSKANKIMAPPAQNICISQQATKHGS